MAGKKDKGLMKNFAVNAIKDRVDAARRVRTQKKNGPDKRPKAALIVGAGALPGIGASVAMRAARGGLRVYVAGRNTDKIKATADLIAEQGGDVIALQLDVSNQQQMDAAFARVQDDGYALDLLVYNVGTNRPKPFLDITPELMTRSWENDCLAGFLAAQQAVEIMLERGGGTILFTGASASMRGKAGFAPFAQAKAGLRMLAQALAREFGPQGIHVAHFIIDGMVDGDRLRGVIPQILDRQGKDGSLAPTAIAETYWEVYQQHRSAWTHEIDLRPFKENW